MMKQKTLVAVEVKFRKQCSDLGSLITKKKHRALARGLERFLALEEYKADTVRVDLAVVTILKNKLTIRHYLPNIIDF